MNTMQKKIKECNLKLFDNIGRKIKMIAKVLFWIGAVASIVGGIAIFVAYVYNIFGWALYYRHYEYILYAILGLIGIPCIGTLVSWLSVVGVYAFGSFVEDTAANKETLRRIEEQLKQGNLYNEKTNEQ